MTPSLGNRTCSAHNAHTARQVFGEAFIDAKRAQRAPPVPDIFDKLKFALCEMGFGQREVKRVLADLQREQAAPEAEPLLRAALSALTPASRSACRSPSG